MAFHKRALAFAGAFAIVTGAGHAQIRQTKTEFEDMFRQLGSEIRDPNVYRSASGAPGPEYWQQKVDYDIQVRLDEDAKRITASETIAYTNNAPEELEYLWFALDQNRFKNESIARLTETASTMGSRRSQARGAGDSVNYAALRREFAFEDRDHGFEITSVTDARGRELDYVINDTMLRVDLPAPLRTGRTETIKIDFAFNIIHESVIGGRGGYEHFEESDTYQYALAQWFPRAAAFTDYDGWNNKQFLGRGEFTLEFGDYRVAITVPEDHIVASTGELRNANRVLTAEQRRRLAEAEGSDEPIFIVTPEEARENERDKATGEKTWVFEAQNVRDFAWASSRKYIWDAMGVTQAEPGAEHPRVLAMSYYPNEAEPIWSQYSSHAVAHTIDVYSRFAFPYPYPTAISVNAWKAGGMEYPMITFNGYRPETDEDSGERVYSRRIKYGLIGVIIHEIGHIYFPMTVNSDERQWTWMDEGLNTFLEYMAELEWDEDYPTFGGRTNLVPYITAYMKSDNQVPIMTQSDSILQFGPNAYSKPAAALTILRETVMGRELFDHAFRTYSRRWRFKRPTPEDFFRTMEDASGVDLDWFWRGWFFSTDHVDLAVSDVRIYQASTKDPEIEFEKNRERDIAQRVDPTPLTVIANRADEDVPAPRVDRVAGLKDFYDANDKYTVSNKDRNEFSDFRKKLEPWEKEVLDRAIEEDLHFHFVDFENLGGIPMPLPLRITYDDGSVENLTIPAEIWRRSARGVTKVLVRDKRAARIEIDADNNRIADVDMSNNAYPPRIVADRFELYKNDRKERNLMADMLVALKDEEDGADDSEEAPLEPADR